MKTSEELLMLAKMLEDMQLAFEPIRDKALDQKSFYTGYAAAAEQFIKILLGKATGLKQEARTLEDQKKMKEQELIDFQKDIEMKAMPDGYDVSFFEDGYKE
jgi:hypothetical protein